MNMKPSRKVEYVSNKKIRFDFPDLFFFSQLKPIPSARYDRSQRNRDCVVNVKNWDAPDAGEMMLHAETSILVMHATGSSVLEISIKE